MIFERFTLSDLEKYHTLAWDIDETLIQNRSGKAFADYILSHTSQKHLIVTHRSHGWERNIFKDFRIWFGIEKAERLFNSFENVHSVPNEMFWNYQDALRVQEEDTDEPFDPAHLDIYYNWKGKICSEGQAGALIDDNIKNCYPGCAKYGVDFYWSYGLKNG